MSAIGDSGAPYHKSMSPQRTLGSKPIRATRSIPRPHVHIDKLDKILSTRKVFISLLACEMPAIHVNGRGAAAIRT